uniref:GSVIVT00018410001 n=1 Tax=Arundo donax TaxID=35708 RepID=A0A0A9F1Q4_ARUDO
MVMFSTRAHLPTVECHPMMLLDTHACCFTRAPRITVHRDSRTPASTTHPGPIATSGPIRQPSPMTAVSCTSTLPRTCPPDASLPGVFFRRESRYRRRPVM